MYDIKPLEEEWKKYHRKKRRPVYLFFFLLLGLLGGIFAFLNVKEFKIPNFSTQNSSKQSSDITTAKGGEVLLNDALYTLQVNKVEVIENIKPPVQMKVARNTVEPAPTLPIVDNIPVLEIIEKPKPRKKPKKVARKPKIIKDKPRKKMHLNIIESSSVSAYKDVEKRFYESRDTDDSLFLAKSYYRKGKYKKAEYWALQTNKVNSNIEESWIIFAQSKLKLGRRNEAISLLTNYLKRSNSNRIRSLLYKLKKN